MRVTVIERQKERGREGFTKRKSVRRVAERESEREYVSMREREKGKMEVQCDKIKIVKIASHDLEHLCLSKIVWQN